jgi:hypothetical protein
VRFEPEDYYVRTGASVVPGALFVGVPIAFLPPRLPAVALAPDGTLRQQDFGEAWRTAPQSRRDEGIPVMMRAKARPALVLRVGAAVTDRVYEHSIWAAPLYGERDPPRRGPNIFPLPAWPDVGLVFAGYADLYQATMVPMRYFQNDRPACALSQRAILLLLGALALWAEADPTPSAR